MPLTTENPQNSNSSASSSKPEMDVEKPGEQKPDVIVSSSTSTTAHPFPTIPVVVISENPHPPSSKPKGEKNGKPQNEKVSSTQKPEKPGEKQPESSVTNISIKPPSTGGSNKGVNQNNQQAARGEGIRKKCSEGFTRDKLGRCRKLRRTPSIP